MFIEHVALCFVEPDEIRYLSLKKITEQQFHFFNQEVF